MTQTDVMTLIQQLLQEQGFIPALTIHQPYASLLACKAKRYETRGWATKRRGWTLIHAGKGLPDFLKGYVDHKFIYAVQNALFADYLHVDMWSNIAQLLPRGEIIAIAELVGCWPIEHERLGCLPVVVRANSKHPRTPIYTDTPEYLFGDFSPDRYAWEFANMTMLPEPIKVAGKQKLWKWRGEGLGRALAQVCRLI